MTPAIVPSHHCLKFYIDGAWVEPHGSARASVIDPAREEKIAEIPLGSEADIDRAVAAASTAFTSFSCTTVAERIALLRRVLACYSARSDELAWIMTLEMGAPIRRTRDYMCVVGARHLQEIISVLERRSFEVERGSTRIVQEPIGVCGLITPWNAPITQILSKVAPGLAAGCTMVLKPSELSPLNAVLLAEILDEAGVPRGVFNLVQGDGATAGAALARHPSIDMISFTGSTRAGIAVAKLGADTVKRVHQELGGKSANILLDDVDLEDAVSKGVRGCFANSGQSCVSPGRMLVPRSVYERAVDIAKRTAEAIPLGDPRREETELGPLVSQQQFDRVQSLIASGIAQGARLVAGGPGRAAGYSVGYFARPTVFADVTPDMTIAHEEIFGPVLTLFRYDTEEEAVHLANGTAFGLAAHVQSGDPERAAHCAKRLRAGYVYINYAAPDYSAPFGGYRMSGNGREYGEWGLEAFLEHKTLVGCRPAPDKT